LIRPLAGEVRTEINPQDEHEEMQEEKEEEEEGAFMLIVR
jgi:hypothetical protein